MAERQERRTKGKESRHKKRKNRCVKGKINEWKRDLKGQRRKSLITAKDRNGGETREEKEEKGKQKQEEKELMWKREEKWVEQKIKDENVGETGEENELKERKTDTRRGETDAGKRREMGRIKNRINGDGKDLIPAQDRKDRKRRERKRMERKTDTKREGTDAEKRREMGRIET